MAETPLHGMRVIDFTSDVAGPYATKLLADFGADVIKVEPPTGDTSRHSPPFFHNQPHPEGSARFLALNTNKRSIVADLETADGRDFILKLIATASVVVEDFAPGYLAERGLAYEQLDGIRPGVVLTSITPWGQSGPYLGYRQSDITAQAMAGPMLWTGSLEREPLKNAGEFAHYHAGIAAALATAMAYVRQQRAGHGDWIDISIYESQAASRDRSSPYLTTHSYTGMEPRRGHTGMRVASGTRPALDGYVSIMGSRRMPAFLEMIGCADLLADGRVAGPPHLFPPELIDEMEGRYLVWLMQHTKREAVADAQRHRLLSGTVNTIVDVLADPHFQTRGVWETIDHPHTGPVVYPGRPFLMTKSPRPNAGPAPLLGEHTHEIQDDLAVTGSGLPPAAARSGRALPLSGVRALDLAVVWAGPHATQLLAEWGAEVIRVEPISSLQPSTRYVDQPTTREEQLARAALGMAMPGSFPDFEPGARPWDRHAAFNSHARNKLSATADIFTEEGRALFLKLVALSDIVVENNVPETIERARLTYEDLVTVNPNIIYVRMPAYGLSGPYKNYRAYGSHIEGSVGHYYIQSYPDAPPDDAGGGVASDAIGGMMAAFAAVVALRHRDRTGEGQQVEVAQAEAFFPLLSDFILDWTMNGCDTPPQGNYHRTHVPYGAYPCQGEDEWLAIDIETDDEFRSLCSILGASEMATDLRYSTVEARLTNRLGLDKLLGLLTARYEKFDLFGRLQAARLVAGPLMTAAEKFACPQLTARGFFEYLENEAVGRHRYPGLMWKMQQTENWLRRAPCTLGQDNEYVWRGLAGLSATEYENLRGQNQIGERYVRSILEKWPSVMAAERG